MLVGTKVCELTDGFLWFVCGNFDVSPILHEAAQRHVCTCIYQRHLSLSI